MLNISNYFTSITFKGHSKQQTMVVPEQLMLEFPGLPDTFDSSRSEPNNGTRLRLADMFEDFEDRESMPIKQSAKVNTSNMSPVELEAHIKQEFNKLRKTIDFHKKNNILNELCKINSNIVTEELRTLYKDLRHEKEGNFKIYVLDAAMSRTSPTLKHKFTTLATSSDYRKREQALNALIKDERKEISIALKDILDFMPGSNNLGINIIEELAQRCNPLYKGQCKNLVDPNIAINIKKDFLDQLKSDKTNQAETIQIHLLKFLRSCLPAERAELSKNDSKLTDSTHLRIKLIEDLFTNAATDASPEITMNRTNKLKSILLNEVKISDNPLPIRETALDKLALMLDPDIHESIRKYVNALDYNVLKTGNVSSELKAFLDIAKKFLKNKHF